MKHRDHRILALPDVAVEAPRDTAGTLDWVGMAGIELPIAFDAGNGETQRCGARVDAFVNLTRAASRGIHMSRLYLLLDGHLGGGRLDGPVLERLLHAFLRSQDGLADRARVSLRFEHLVRRAALRSGNSGWRAYPVLVEALLDERGFRWELETAVTYSSTCPASAALARQLIQQQFAGDFRADAPLDHAAVMAWLGSERGIVATPHAQRSTAQVRVRPAQDAPLDLLPLLDRIEQALATPVQTAVKREDEQAFALANGGNLMFCEDAARRIQRALHDGAGIARYRVRVEHHESLHPHDAVAHASGGEAAGGWIGG
ncbi:GTP cyclohydrolase FolE2 [Dyella sedimenti]|uniref:GTP cyclohydrolase FolE2 n=1 Tax=Dyella sedimenti TaxID=2919947 RepID=UPI001FAAF729|nr:GTP cyclohydrolase FolE2 [Dyella sedimenti]